MRVLRNERAGEATGFYPLEAGVLGVCRHVEVEVSSGNRTRCEPVRAQDARDSAVRLPRRLMRVTSRPHRVLPFLSVL